MKNEVSQLTDEAREARNAYMRKWRAEHKDYVREMNRKYWEKKKEEKEMAKQIYNDEFHADLRARVRKHRDKTAAENLCEYCVPFYDEDKDSKDLMEASITQFPHLAAQIWINLDGKLELWVGDDNGTAKTFEAKIKFCPMCGKRLVKNG